MALFVHLTPEQNVRSILRNGIKVGMSGKVYAMPVVPDFYLTHQWLRELKRRFGGNGWRTMCAVYFRIPDSTLVWVGHFNSPHQQLSAAAAAKQLMQPETPLGFEVYLTRSVLRKEIHKVRAMPQVVGWRYLPNSHGRIPCGCYYCSYGTAFRRKQRNEFKAEEKQQGEEIRRRDRETYTDLMAIGSSNWFVREDVVVSEVLVRIDVWSDYNCPWCFLASSSLEKLEASHNVEVTWHSYELRPQGSPPMSAEFRARIEANKPRLLSIAREQYGLELNQGPFSIDSRPALRGAKYAEQQGRGQEYHHALMYGYWTEAKDISDINVLADLAESIGLDRDAYLAALDDPDFDDEVQSDIEQAQRFGLNSVPAMVFDDRYLISGAQPYPVLVQATEHVQAELQKSEA